MYNIVLVSGVQQSDLNMLFYIYIYIIFRFFSSIGY